MDEIDSSNKSIPNHPYIEGENGEYNESQGTNVNVHVPDGKEVNISLKDKDPKSSKPQWMMVGTGNIDRERKGTRSMDYTKELLNMTKPEGFMFAILMDNRITEEVTNGKNQTFKVKRNLTHIVNAELTKTEKKYISDAYKLLRQKDIIVRTKREHYIINPRLVISNDFWKKDEKLYTEAVEKLQKKDIVAKTKQEQDLEEILS